MNKQLVKNIALFVFLPTAVAAGIWGYNYYKRKKNEPTDEQLDEIVKLFTKREVDVLTGINRKIYEKIVLPNFKKNVLKEEADEIIAIGKIDREWTGDENTKLLNFFPKILGASSVNAMGIPNQEKENDKYLEKYQKDFEKINQKNKSLWR